MDHDYLFKSEIVSIKQLDQGYELSIRNAVDVVEKISCEWVINASGLQSDIVANMVGDEFPKLKYS